MSLHLDILEPFKGLHIHLAGRDILWATRGYSLLCSRDQGKSWDTAVSVPARAVKSLAGLFTLSSRLFRTGIQQVFPLPSGNLLLISDGVFHRFEPDKNQLREVHRLRFGRRPLKSACCVDGEGNVYYGEYWLNPERREVMVHKSADDGISWVPAFTFEKGSVRHIHALQHDRYTGRLWIATGDLDPECRIGYSENGGEAFHFIGSGSELWRAVTLLFTEDYVFWGTDGEREQNGICRWKRPDGPAERLVAIGGPVYHAARIENGTFLIATGVEGAATEWDDYCRIWASPDGERWEELAKWQKDRWHPVFGYGTVSFAAGHDREGCFFFSAHSLKGIHGCTFRARVRPSS